MGHPTNLFSPDPASNYICVICHDVLEDACSVKECGHTFCRGCIKAYLETNNGESCPNCRINISGYIPNYFARYSVDELQVKCFEGSCSDDQDNDGSSDNGTIKRKRDDGDDKSCNWKGPLKDLINHKENLCPFKLVTCSVGGCDHTCFRKDMESHISGGFLTHMMLIQRENDKKMKEMVKHVQSECDKKIKSVQSECDKTIKDLEMQMQHSRYIRDCREWLEHKPDALTDFSIYMIRERDSALGLLCYIPGPKDTAWEGAKIPMLLRYRRAHQPPNCKFPAGFFHTNVYPSGTVCVSTVNETEGWSPETSLPEVLFTVQQLLSHPNPNSPAQAPAYHVYATEGPESYYRRIKEEANVYSNYSGHHSKVSELLERGKFDGKVFVDEMEINELGKKWHSGRKLHSVNANGKCDCKCSCCVLGRTFWDDKKKMRFLFGIGG